MRLVKRITQSLRPRLPTAECSKQFAGRAGALLNEWFGNRVGEGFGILVYHRVTNRQKRLPAPTINVTPASFRRQIVGLISKGYRISSLRRVLRLHREGKSPPPRTIVVTFDDGFESVYRHAWPVLRALRVPATVFVSTAFVDSAEPFPFDGWGIQYRNSIAPQCYRPLSTSQIREMAAGGLVEFGSHTHTHDDFRDKPNDFGRDLRLSVEILRSMLGTDAVSFAFPFGRKYLNQVSDRLFEEAKISGVTCALTTECERIDPHRDPFGWGRFNVYDWDTAGTIAGKLGGWYGWAPKVQEWMYARKMQS